MLLLDACRRAEREDGAARARAARARGARSWPAATSPRSTRPARARRSIVRGIIGLLEESVEILDRLRIPVVARVQGAVAGAGFSLMMAADVVVASDDARLSFAYTSIGTTPDGGLSWSLPRAVGLRRAMEIALLGEPIDAQEALRLGLLTKVVPIDELDAETARVAERLAGGPTLALGRTRELLRNSSAPHAARTARAGARELRGVRGHRGLPRGGRRVRRAPARGVLRALTPLLILA